MIPKIVMTVHGAVVEFDRRLEEAARTIGANELQALLYVVIPTLAPAFISAAAISFYTSMGAFELPLPWLTNLRFCPSLCTPTLPSTSRSAQQVPLPF